MPRGAVLMGFLAFVAAVVPALPVRAEPAPVEATGAQFTPREVRVPVDEMVRWSIVEGEHTITSDEGFFDSGPVGRGTVFVARFHNAGRYPYYCRVHGGAGGVGMSGVVTVGSPPAPTTTTVPTTAPAAPTTSRPTVAPTTTTTAPGPRSGAAAGLPVPVHSPATTTPSTTAPPSTTTTTGTPPTTAPAVAPTPPPADPVAPAAGSPLSAAPAPSSFPSVEDLGPVDVPDRDRTGRRAERLNALPASSDESEAVEGIRDVVVVIVASVLVVFGLFLARPDRRRRA